MARLNPELEKSLLSCHYAGKQANPEKRLLSCQQRRKEAK
jgi:hypothetical protein